MAHERDKLLQPWSSDSAAVLKQLGVDPGKGLGGREVAIRRRLWGRNLLREARRRHVLAILADQFRSIVVVLLGGAAVLALLFSEVPEALAIVAVLLINGLIGFVTEWRATRSMEALRQMARVECSAVRDGLALRLSAEELVPGDIVLLDAGDVVPADLRLVEVAKLAADESTLTGESLPVDKHTDPLSPNTPVFDQENMAFKGTAITRGTGRGVVVATGMRTELGKIYEQVSTAEPRQTPLERRLDALGNRLAWVVLVIAVLIAGGGILAGRDVWLAVEVAIALSVAAIPEGLPIVATVALARGMRRMARRNALVTRLSAVETLGATSVILCDKTGTMTENRMTATTMLLAGRDVEFDAAAAGGDGLLDELLEAASLCSNASLQRADDGALQAVGDPTELALLMAAAARGIWRASLLEQYPELREDAFDPDSKRMATLHACADGVAVAVKGAPEAVLPSCTSVVTGQGEAELDAAGRQEWLARAEALAGGGLRTIAVARKRESAADTDPYTNLSLLGIVGLEDPAREGVAQAISECRDAGVSVIMVTGDHASTAASIGADVGISVEAGPGSQYVSGEAIDRLFDAGATPELMAARVFSRVAPQQKLRLIDLYQRQGHVVGMTGDGVNDAPALRKADIGIAMGRRGTAVAKEAAEMVLQDDEFATIVHAIAQGRVIFENIRKFVVYLLSCNISEILIVGLATIAGAPLPLLPLQILFLNLVTDVFPALALGVGEGSHSLMESPPRPSGERILTRAHWRRILVQGLIMAVTVLGAMAVAIGVLGYGREQAVTIAFCTLAFAQMWHVFNMRDEPRRALRNDIVRNPWLWSALAICALLVLAAVYLPALAEVLTLTAPGLDGWLLILGSSALPVVLVPLFGLVGQIRRQPPPTTAAGARS